MLQLILQKSNQNWIHEKSEYFIYFYTTLIISYRFIFVSKPHKKKIMTENKMCCRIFPIVLLFISLILNSAIWFFDEKNYTFSFLTDKTEIFNFLGTLLFIAIIPIGLFYWLNDKEKFRNKARVISLIGFLPPILILSLLLFLK